MSLLLGIPWDIARDILVEWNFSLALLGTLEVAVGSALAGDYKEKLKLLVYPYKYYDRSVSLYSWSCTRQLSVKFFHIDKFCYEFFTANPQANFPTGSVDELFSMPKDKFSLDNLAVINKCTSLKKCTTSNKGLLVGLNSALLSQITELYLGEVDASFEADIRAVLLYKSIE